jgi:hypothetical protein
MDFFFTVAESCLEILRRNPALNGTDGVYRINTNGETKEVFCDMTTQGGGWTVSTEKSGTGNIKILREVKQRLFDVCKKRTDLWELKLRQSHICQTQIPFKYLGHFCHTKPPFKSVGK